MRIRPWVVLYGAALPYLPAQRAIGDIPFLLEDPLSLRFPLAVYSARCSPVYLSFLDLFLFPMPSYLLTSLSQILAASCPTSPLLNCTLHILRSFAGTDTDALLRRGSGRTHSTGADTPTHATMEAPRLIFSFPGTSLFPASSSGSAPPPFAAPHTCDPRDLDRAFPPTWPYRAPTSSARDGVPHRTLVRMETSRLIFPSSFPVVARYHLRPAHRLQHHHGAKPPMRLGMRRRHSPRMWEGLGEECDGGIDRLCLEVGLRADGL
ncbi:hypothetical protein C8R45DRAFT_1223129 [Mycena sanguinolenta]|nr:hypothetical protein C8R45DRAFT_1223129 [Mycena sanguinolenta]